MAYHPDALRQVIADRQADLRAEAARQRLARPTPMRTRTAHLLRRVADRFDSAGSPCSHVRAALFQRT